MSIAEEGEETDSVVDGIEQDVFTCFIWSKAKQESNAVQLERLRMRDKIRDTPFFRAYKDSGVLDGSVAGLNS